MITIFTIPKPFTDPHIRLIQRNAISSWKRMHPDIEIILLGNDAGIADTAREFDLIHIPQVAVTEYGTPLLNSAFSLVRARARHELMMYANADMILTSDFIPVIKKAPDGQFLMCGMRWDLDVTVPIDFSDPAWQETIKSRTHMSGTLHSAAGIDYFIFRKESFADMPALVVGRIGWDNWMIWYCRKNRIPVIDITRAVTAVHQNHGYPSYNIGIERKTNPEAKQNLSFITTKMNDLTIDGADLKMDRHGTIKKKRASLLTTVRKVLRGGLQA